MFSSFIFKDSGADLYLSSSSFSSFLTFLDFESLSTFIFLYLDDLVVFLTVSFVSSFSISSFETFFLLEFFFFSLTVSFLSPVSTSFVLLSDFFLLFSVFNYIM
ncbi:hypothetical protein BCR36DRAFT_55258 [Piromyces finnis]|uniref:Uncharacterized protein n=1 Tax=Piromyces finnis TaxID=1754191 RepID=A0A1Y1V9Q9_9FUNG|nr:hypothetical protein BCR36DRAFT_55258 [Piromyces finnis]|eukprot:ORX50710.1 hypothetical protein BCR36DRAFT_55258 [Piromyces finnis]